MGQSKEQRQFLREKQELAREQAEAGRSPSFIIDDLIAEGLDQPTAVRLVNEARGDKPQNFGRSERGHRAMLVGALWMGGGLAVTLFTFMAATGGGSFVVAWGAILWGAIKFAQGLTGSDDEVG